MEIAAWVRMITNVLNRAALHERLEWYHTELNSDLIEWSEDGKQVTLPIEVWAKLCDYIHGLEED